MLKIHFKNTLAIAFVLVSFFCVSQNSSETIESRYLKQSKLPREQAYTHLNKSVYIKGEMLAFQSYIFDKGLKKLTKASTNLYCTIDDSDGLTIKEGLFLIENGTVNNIFEIDSLFTSGNYTFKTYTNWMLNFNEKLAFVQNFRVIDAEVEKEEKNINELVSLDIQVLPEGGHLIANVNNTLGVIIKNQLGKGLKVNEIALINQKNDTISKLNLNDFGIGKTILNPKPNDTYFLTFKSGYNEIKHKIEDPKALGIVMSTNFLKEDLFISLKTNAETLPYLKDKIYKLIIHNTESIKSIDIEFDQKNKVLKQIKQKDLFSGINILTLFDDKEEPILERLIFNHDGINTVSPKVISSKKESDSITVSMQIPNIETNKLVSLSISVLPDTTVSYKQPHNITSYITLNPYIKGDVENVNYYFQDINKRKKYDLDLLLLTQGWSSYSWTSHFNTEPSKNYAFERGIAFTANINKSKTNQFIIQPLKYSKTLLFNLNPEDKKFEAKGLYPIEGEFIKISELNNKGLSSKPSIYFSFSPRVIPYYPTKNYSKLQQQNLTLLNAIDQNDQLSKDNSEVLEEVILNTNVTRTRYEKLKNRSAGSIDIFDDNKRVAYTDFATYISSKGYFVNQPTDRQGGEAALTIVNTRRTTIGGLQSPLIYLDGVLLSDFSILANYRMDTVDYIEVDKTGAGEGVRGAAGVIRIFTDPSVRNNVGLNKERFQFQEFKFKLNFKERKKYYSPKYQSYFGDFFDKYGTIAWVANPEISSIGRYSFKILNTQTKTISLFIEGVTEDGTFISGKETIEF